MWKNKSFSTTVCGDFCISCGSKFKTPALKTVFHLWQRGLVWFFFSLPFIVNCIDFSFLIWNVLFKLARFIIDVIFTPFSFLGCHFLLAFDRAEHHSFNWHELLTNQALAATWAQETFFRGMPMESTVAHTLSFRVNSIVTALACHCMVLHIARLAHWLVIHHHINFPSQDTITIKATKMLQVPVLSFCLSVFIAENQLITASTAWLLTVTVMATTVKLPFFPEVDHIN